MDYKKTAYGSFYDREGRVWGINLFRRTDSAMIARELSFEATEAAVVEWDEFDLEEPIQGSSLTLRIISEADREWISLYTVNDGDVVAEVTLDDELWWRGSLDPETYEEPYERADDYTVTLRFSDFGPLKRHMFSPVGGGGLCKTGRSIGSNLLAIGTVTELDESGLPANVDLSAIAVPEGNTVSDMLGIGAAEDAFKEDEESDDYIKAWDALSALLTASNIRMVQRAGKIVLHNLKGLRDNSTDQAEECVWSGDSQTLSADRIASRVVVKHEGDGESNLVKELKTGREQDEKVIELYFSDGGSGPAVTLYKTSTWKKTDGAWGFFTMRGGRTSNIPSAEGWMMWAYRNDSHNSVPFYTAIKDYPYYTKLQSASAGMFKFISSPTGIVAITPKTYIHLTSEGIYNMPYAPAAGYRIKIEQEMLFDCRYNPFATDEDIFQSLQDRYAETQMVYVLAFLELTTESGKKYYWTNQDKVFGDVSVRKISAPCDSSIGTWSESMMPYWIQYRPKEKKGDGQTVGAGWIKNKPFVTRPYTTKWKDFKINSYTQALPDGDFIPLPPERGWLTLEITNALEFVGGPDSPADALNAMRWILGKGAKISIVDAGRGFETPESSESEIKVICNNGAEEPLEISPLLGSGGGYLGCRSIIIDSDGKAEDKGVPELRTATETASQLCIRRTKLSGEAYINTTAPMTFTERIQTGRIFLLSSERMDLQAACGDRTITELVRTDIEGLEVRRNERVIYEGTADRGGRDGRDAEVYSIIPTATAVGSKYATRMTEGPLSHLERYIKHTPEAVGCSVYLTVGSDMTKTRDGVLMLRIYGYDGETLSDEAVETDGGFVEPVTVPERCSAIEFRLLSDDSEDAEVIAICTIPVSTEGLILAEYSEGKLNFVDHEGEKMLAEDIDLGIIEEDCGEWKADGKYRNGLIPNLLTGERKRSHVWYYGCKYRCLSTGTTNPPTWDSSDWEFEEGNPDLTLKWNGSEDSVYEDNPEITLEVSASLYNQDLTDEPRIKWDWSRETWRDGVRDTASDDIWNAAHENTGTNSMDLVKADMNYQFNTRPDRLLYRVTATLLDDAGVPAKASDGTPVTQTMDFEF